MKSWEDPSLCPVFLRKPGKLNKLEMDSNICSGATHCLPWPQILVWPRPLTLSSSPSPCFPWVSLPLTITYVATTVTFSFPGCTPPAPYPGIVSAHPTPPPGNLPSLMAKTKFSIFSPKPMPPAGFPILVISKPILSVAQAPNLGFKLHPVSLTPSTSSNPIVSFFRIYPK